MSILIEDQSLKNGNGGRYTYRDININRNTNVKDRSFAVDDLFAIRGAIVNLLSIRKGSRILDPNFGNELDEYLFEQISEEHGRMLGEEIEDTLLQETRIVVQDVIVTVDKPNGKYDVEIFFGVPTLSQRDLTLQIGLNQTNGIELNL